MVSLAAPLEASFKVSCKVSQTLLLEVSLNASWKVLALPLEVSFIGTRKVVLTVLF